MPSNMSYMSNTFWVAECVCVILAAKRVMASFKIGHNRNEKQWEKIKVARNMKRWEKRLAKTCSLMYLKLLLLLLWLSLFLSHHKKFICNAIKYQSKYYVNACCFLSCKWQTIAKMKDYASVVEFQFRFHLEYSTCITNQIRILSGYSRMVRNKTKSSNTIAVEWHCGHGVRFHLEICLSSHAFPYNVFAKKTIFPTSREKKFEFDMDIHVFFFGCFVYLPVWSGFACSQLIHTHSILMCEHVRVNVCVCLCVRLCPKWRK